MFMFNKMRLFEQFSYLIIVSLLIQLTRTASLASNELKFTEEPSTTYLTKTTPAILRCKIENARTGFFKCNDQWSQDPVNSKIIQIGNKQILFIEQAITKAQLEEFKKQDQTNEFWCVCQGWLNSADDTLVSQKAYVKLAFIDQRFEWEPFPTSGLIGKSVEIRCLAPEGEPKPSVYWLKNNQIIDKSNKRILISNEGSLLINEVRLTDSANYTCIAENLAGKRLSDSAELTVTENKGWSEWSNWTECIVPFKECGEGIQKRTRQCLNPPTINNAIGCDGFPLQSITCYIPCNANSIKATSAKSILNAGWTQWSSWSMTCNSDCLRTRQRDCRINQSEKRSEKRCVGSELEFGNCTFYCEPLSNYLTTATIKLSSYMAQKQYLISTFIAIILLSILIFTSVIITRKCLITKKEIKKDCIQIEINSNDHYPIYYSVQPDYSQDQYMELNTSLLTKHIDPLKMSNDCELTTIRNNINEHSAYKINKKNCNGCSSSCSSSNDEHCNASRNCSTASTSSGTCSTTSSKIILNTSPTDSLVKSYSNQIASPLLKHSNQLDDYENNAYQIMKLINERKHHLSPIMAKNIKNVNIHIYDLYSFSINKSGGFLEIPKFASYLMLPDDTVTTNISTGILKTNNQDLIHLEGDQTLLSSFFLVQTDNMEDFTKPIILSFDHSAQFAESDWSTAIYYKSPNNDDFEPIDEDLNENFYSHIVSNRCYVLTERTGIYALVGQPKHNNLSNSTKEMKYAILLVNGTVKVYFLANNRAAIEIFNEEIQKTNAKVIKMPETFELNYPRQLLNRENVLLSLDVNVVYKNKLISFDSISRKMRLLEIWNSSKDFIEIDIPIVINSQQNAFNFDLGVELKIENNLIFSYSSSNANTSDLHTACCNQQEFYSSVSVSPVFLPLNISSLLDEYVSRCFKMNTLKKNDWKLFANLLKCDKNVLYFSNKDNSFELIMSLWLMINLNKSFESINN